MTSRSVSCSNNHKVPLYRTPRATTRNPSSTSPTLEPTAALRTTSPTHNLSIRKILLERNMVQGMFTHGDGTQDRATDHTDHCQKRLLKLSCRSGRPLLCARFRSSHADEWRERARLRCVVKGQPCFLFTRSHSTRFLALKFSTIAIAVRQV